MMNRPELDERHPVIRARRVDFDWEKTPLHWIPNDPVATHLVNCFHLMLPTGEKWFVQCVVDALPEIKDEKLREEVKGFIGQETVHARAHQGVLEDLLEAHGIDHRVLTRGTQERIDRREEQRRGWSKKFRRRFLMFELAYVAAAEHYTAVLGRWILEDRTWERIGVDPTMLDMLRWHGAEEIEHRSVVFDVYERLGGSYRMRATAFVLSLVLIAYGFWPGTMELLRQDPTIKGKVTFRKVFLGYRRSVRKGHLPNFIPILIAESKVYLKRTHHPSQMGSTQAALDYLAISPAAQTAAPVT
ncbi:MAG: metal-dependent hydrolase [Streptosporangiaceae bacterium]